MIRISVLAFVFCSLTMTVAAQINPVYQELQKNRKGHSKTKFGENKQKAKFDFMVDMGYDDSTVVKLKKIGIDVNELRSKMQLNEKEKVVFSDCIVIGTVVKIEDPVDTPHAKIEYATIASVKPEEFLRNDYHLGQAEIPVMIISGPIGNGLEIIEAGEETLQLGEHVLLFLSAKSLLTFNEQINKKKFKTFINDSTIRFEILGFGGKYLIYSDKVKSRTSYMRNLDDVKNEIKTVVHALSR